MSGPARIADVDRPQAGVVHDEQVLETAARHDLNYLADAGSRVMTVGRVVITLWIGPR
jgi:hypothetical protein